MDLIEEYKQDLLNRLLDIIGVNRESLPIAVTAETFIEPSVTMKFRRLIPAIRKFYSSDKNTALHANAFNKQKNPGLNLVRQILREHGYEVKTQIRDSSAGPKQKFYVIKRPDQSLVGPLPISQVNKDKVPLVVKKRDKIPVEITIKNN